MKDYSEIGLDSKLRKTDSIASRREDFRDAFSFDANTDIGILAQRQLRGDLVSQFDTVEYDDDLDTTSATYTDVTGSEMSFNLEKKSKVFFIASIYGWVDDLSTGDVSVSLWATLNIDGTDEARAAILEGHTIDVGGEVETVVYGQMFPFHKIVELDAGDHTIKLVWKRVGTEGTVNIGHYVFSYIVLGT